MKTIVKGREIVSTVEGILIPYEGVKKEPSAKTVDRFLQD